jgi:citrate synthase
METDPKRFLKITDTSTGKEYKIPIKEDTIETKELTSLGYVVYDNGYLNTAVCRSSITYIDGEKGILRYRGYDIQDLVEHSTFLEVSYLLIFGHLPTKQQFETWETRMMRHTCIHENLVQYLGVKNRFFIIEFSI